MLPPSFHQLLPLLTFTLFLGLTIIRYNHHHSFCTAFPFATDVKTASQKTTLPKTIMPKTILPKATSQKTTTVKKIAKMMGEQEIIRRLLQSYDWRVRPRGTNASKEEEEEPSPVIVMVNILLRSLSRIDSLHMEYSTQLTLHQEWQDERLAYERLAVGGQKAPPHIALVVYDHLTDRSQQIWMPDTFFKNELEARRHLIDKPNALIKIHPDGRVLYSVRLSLVLSCPMSLEYFPLDHQTCLIDIASYAYTTEDIEYEWKKPHGSVQVRDGLQRLLTSFDLQNVTTDYCTSSTNTGAYSCLRVKLDLQREFWYFLLQLYAPTFMLVMASWVSFWLDEQSTTARITLGIVTLLVMTEQIASINAQLALVRYTKAVDVWISGCKIFIFGALLEVALARYDLRMDAICRFAFPIAYAFFNAVYWTIYLN